MLGCLTSNDAPVKKNAKLTLIANFSIYLSVGVTYLATIRFTYVITIVLSLLLSTNKKLVKHPDQTKIQNMNTEPVCHLKLSRYVKAL